MIVLRSEEEIDSIRRAGGIIAVTLGRIKNCIRPGVRTEELDGIARDEIIRMSGYPAFKGYRGFPANICTSVNEEVVHGIPSGRRLRDGDIISVDIGVRFREYFADAAMTFGVGKISPSAQRLIDVTRESLDAAIGAVKPGIRLSDVSAKVQEIVEAGGFSVVRAFVGHGIGTKIHEEPEIPNYGRPGTGPRLNAGMVLAIEPMVNAGSFEVEILDNGWTAVTKDRRLSAHFEHTVVVREDGVEVLTEG